MIMRLETIPNTPMKILLEPVYFEFQGQTLKIPVGFAFDWASIPQILNWIIPPNDTNHLQYWLEHDYLYSEVCIECQDRQDADIHYVKDMKPTLLQWIIYTWVRFWGWLSWKKDVNYKKYKITIWKHRDKILKKAK